MAYEELRQDDGRTPWVSGSLKLRIAFSVLPVVLTVGWLNSRARDMELLELLLGNAIWAVVTLIAVGICVLLGRTAGASNATPLWIVGLLTSLLLAGFCLLTILSIGMLIFPLAMVLLAFSLVNLAAGFSNLVQSTVNVELQVTTTPGMANPTGGRNRLPASPERPR